MAHMDAHTLYDRLSHPARRFVDEYVKTMKVGKAADAAQISSVTASRLMKDAHVCRAIAFALDEKSRLARIDASWVLKRVALLADFSIKNFIVVDDNGRLYYDFSAASEEDWYCINEITVGAVRAQAQQDGARLYVDQVKVKTVDKLKALDMVGKHIAVKAFDDKADDGAPETVTAVTRKVIRPTPALPPGERA